MEGSMLPARSKSDWIISPCLRAVDTQLPRCLYVLACALQVRAQGQLLYLYRAIGDHIRRTKPSWQLFRARKTACNINSAQKGMDPA